MKESKPHQQTYPPIKDRFNRIIDYLRLSVTDRCNLRCTYCMPEEGVPFIPHENIIRFEELEQIVRVFALSEGRKIRITGGEPFVRKGLIQFLRNISVFPHLKLHITTNGVKTYQYVGELAELGIAGVNLSLDTLDRGKFVRIARRDAFQQVWLSFTKLLEAGIPLKINTVVQKGINDDEIIQLARLAEKYPVHVRFIEQMPFNGQKIYKNEHLFSGDEILFNLKSCFPSIKKEEHQASTAELYRIEGFKGRIGIIRGYERAFCSACNRIRITSTGILKNCLYDNGVGDVKTFIREHQPTDEQLYEYLTQLISRKHRDGHVAEEESEMEKKQSMAVIGG